MASYQLCKNDGSLLMNKGKLLSLAREKVHNDGYSYSKKSSRSQIFGCLEIKEKRKHVRQEVREARMVELTENISSQSEAIKFLQQQKTKYSNTETFLEAAEITKSIQNTKKRKLESELQKLKSKEATSSKYHQKKKKRRSSALEEKSPSVSAEGDTDVHISSDDELVPKLKRADSVLPNVLQQMLSGTGSHLDSNISLNFVTEQDTSNQDSAGVEESNKLQVDPSTSSSVSVLATKSNNDQRPFFRLNGPGAKACIEKSAAAGIKEIYKKYTKYLGRNLTDGVKKSNDLYLSHANDLSVEEFVLARETYCQKMHNQLSCKHCTSLITFAKELSKHGLVPLAESCEYCEYKSDKATRRLMQLPVAVFRIKDKLYVAENRPDMNYTRFVKFLNMLVPAELMHKGISSENLKILCELASSENDKKLIRVAATTNFSATRAKKELGISSLVKEREAVAEAVQQYRDKRDAVDEVLSVREGMSLQELGIVCSETETESGADQSDGASDVNDPVLSGCSDSENDIVTDSESENPEDWVAIKELPLYSEEVKAKIKKQRAIFRRQKKRQVAKLVAKKYLLQRRKPARISKTVHKYPDIGKTIEEFARERRIGADSWRRTGLLTFSGNVKRGPKLTYHRIKEHLEEKYSTKFGYGTVVQLCSVHNKRKLSCKRYWGAAQIVSRRARKDFNVKLNVDAKWSCWMYQILD